MSKPSTPVVVALIGLVGVLAGVAVTLYTDLQESENGRLVPTPAVDGMTTTHRTAFGEPGLYLRSKASKGERLTAEMLILIPDKDGQLAQTGSRPSDFEEHLNGTCLAADVPPDRPLAWGDVDLCEK